MGTTETIADLIDEMDHNHIKHSIRILANRKFHTLGNENLPSQNTHQEKKPS
jgi:hypothetical protein